MIQDKSKLYIIPLGGLGEIGKNMTAFSYGNDIIVVDAGLAFPEEEMLGIDIVIPDILYLLENAHLVRAIILTHGHEDHIGALPYLLKDLSVPVYGTKLTLGLLEQKLSEHEMKLPEGSRSLKPREHIKIGPFDIEFFRMNHSIADVVGLGIQTPVGLVVHSGDFKFDQTPVDGAVADYHRLSEYGDRGVLVLLSDSTNAEHEGYTQSERVVGKTLDEVIGSARQRVLVTSFASNVHRIQQVITAAHRHGRKVAVLGRSMENTVNVAIELGYLHVPPGVLVELETLNQLSPNKIVILTTGSQGEPMSALTRMSTNEHRQVEIAPGDTVVIAATPVPGNEKLVHRTIDNLFRLGAEVVYQTTSGVHVSGHASQEELKLMFNLVRPKFFIPIHGEYRHLVRHAELAVEMGIPRSNVLVGENGTVFEFSPTKGRVAGRVSAGNVLVDGLGVGDVGSIVLRDRRQLSQDGIIIVVVALEKETGLMVAGPEIISRGFVYVRESEELIEEAKKKVEEVLNHCEERKISDWPTLKSAVRETLRRHLYDKTQRRPMILPIIVEV
mgnify:CR=1 FL=1